MRITVVLNSRSRNGKEGSLTSVLEEKFGRSLAGIKVATDPRHASDIAREAAKEGVDTVVVAGGDGSINGVLDGLLGTGTALGIISSGTANDLATFYHIPREIPQACDVILERRLQRADVIAVNGHHYVTTGGLGLPARVAEMANEVRRRDAMSKGLTHLLGSRLYILATLYALMRGDLTSHWLTIQANGSCFNSNPLGLVITNLPFVARHFRVAPGAANNDGAFDVCLIEKSQNRLRNLATMLQLLAGRPVRSPFLRNWRAQELVITSQNPLTFFGDGEVLQTERKFRVRVHPNALNVVVP